MRVEDVVEGLNRHIEHVRKVNNLEVKSHLVLKKVISVNPNFKAYKEYIYTVWNVSKEGKHKVAHCVLLERVIAGQEETIDRKMAIGLCESLFAWRGTEDFNKVIKGEYYEHSDE